MNGTTPLYRALMDGGMSRRTALALLGAGATLPWTGRGGFAQDVGGMFQLLTEDTDDPEIAWYKARVEAFTASHPGVQVAYDAVGMSGLFEKLTTALAAGQPPDMVAGSGLSRVATLAKLGVLQPVDDIVEAIGRDDFMPGMVDQFTWDGQVLAVPVQTLSFPYWFRRDLLEQAGLAEPRTWDDLLNVAKTLTRDGVYGICLPGGVNTATARQVLIYFRQGGGNILDADGTIVINSAENRATLEFMKELYQYSPPGASNFGFGDLLTNFQSGICASTYYSGRMLQRVSARAPAIAPSLGCVFPPYKSVRFTYTEPRGAYILAGARNRDAAKAWMVEEQFEAGRHIDWLLTAPDNNLPVRTSIATDARYTGHELLSARADVLAVLLNATETPGNFYKESHEHAPNPVGGSLDTGPVLPTMLQRYVFGNESAETVLSWAAEQIDDMLQNI